MIASYILSELLGGENAEVKPHYFDQYADEDQEDEQDFSGIDDVLQVGGGGKAAGGEEGGWAERKGKMEAAAVLGKGAEEADGTEGAALGAVKQKVSEPAPYLQATYRMPLSSSRSSLQASGKGTPRGGEVGSCGRRRWWRRTGGAEEGRRVGREEGKRQRQEGRKGGGEEGKSLIPLHTTTVTQHQRLRCIQAFSSLPADD